jgi:DNA replication protein DnaC
MFLSDENKELELKKNKRRIVKPCKICGGTGLIAKVDGIYDTFVPCECLKKAKRNIRLLDWGIPRKFLDDKWDLDILKDKSFFKIINKYIDNFIDNYDAGKGLFLTGPHGRGKTTTECVIAKRVSAMINPDTFEDKKRFIVGFSMYDDIVKKQFSKSEEEKTQLKQFLYKSDLLIIDNVGNETGKNEKQFSQRLLEMILRKRDNDCLPTIISSNYNINEIETEYNIDVKDFIIQNDEIVYIAGDNHRIEKQDSFEEF